MKKENYDKAKKIQSEIEKYENTVSIIESILESGAASCSVQGKHSTPRFPVEYVSYNFEFIKKILNDDKANAINYISKLKADFDSL